MEPPQPLAIEERPPPPPDTAKSSGNADRDKFDDAGNGGASATDPQDPDYDAKSVNFERWLQDNGCKYPLLELRKYDTEVRGVHARDDIGPEKIIVEIPLKCLITVEMGKALPVGQAVLAADVAFDAPKHIFLMLFLLTDIKRPDSFFLPYYDILPATLSNMPIFWDKEELKYLEGSYMTTQVEERVLAIEGDYFAICEVYPPFREVATLEEFKWARMCVCSRNFGMDIEGLRTSALVPYADMLNHYRPRETKWTYENDRGAFTITTLSNIHAGAQVYDSYGQKCNHRFLLNYGFAIEKNVEANGFCPNEVPLVFSLDPRDPSLARKGRLWRQDGSQTEAKRIRVCVGDNDHTRSALSLLRVMVATEQELAIIESTAQGGYRTAKDVRVPVSVRNERAAMHKLMTMVQAVENGYPTTLEEDNQQLKTGGLEPFSNRRHAVIQVRGEKVVLRHYLDFASTVLACLAAKDDEEAESRLQRKHRVTVDHCRGPIAHIRHQESAKADATSARWGGRMTTSPTIV